MYPQNIISTYCGYYQRVINSTPILEKEKQMSQYYVKCCLISKLNLDELYPKGFIKLYPFMYSQINSLRFSQIKTIYKMLLHCNLKCIPT